LFLKDFRKILYIQIQMQTCHLIMNINEKKAKARYLLKVLTATLLQVTFLQMLILQYYSSQMSDA